MRSLRGVVAGAGQSGSGRIPASSRPPQQYPTAATHVSSGLPSGARELTGEWTPYERSAALNPQNWRVGFSSVRIGADHLATAARGKLLPDANESARRDRVDEV